MSDDHMASLDHAQATGSALVDLSKIRPGDEVTFAFRVSFTNLHARTGPKHVTVDMGGHMFDMPAFAIVGHTPKSLGVGDTVRHPDFNGRFRIVAIDGQTAWCKRDDGHRHDVPLARMERVND